MNKELIKLAFNAFIVLVRIFVKCYIEFKLSKKNPNIFAFIYFV